MGIFGDLDVNDIPSNPFWVEQGDYSAIVSDGFFHENKTTGQPQIVIEYTITDHASEYYGKKVREYFDYFPDMTKEKLAEMDPEERAIIKRSMSNLKRRLCGNPKNDRKGLGVAYDDITPNWDPKSLKNTEVNMGIVNSGEDNEYSNVKWVNLQDSLS